MVNRRGFVIGALSALAIGPAFAEEAQKPAPQLEDLHDRGPRNFYFNITKQGYEAAFKQPLVSVNSPEALNAALGEHWNAYKDAVKEAVSAFMPQLANDETTLKTLRTPNNFKSIRTDDTRRYNEANILRDFPKNAATNPLYFRIRELAEAGVITAAQGASFVDAIDGGDFYKTELPAFISEQAIAVLAAPKPATGTGQQVPFTSQFN